MFDEEASRNFVLNPVHLKLLMKAVLYGKMIGEDAGRKRPVRRAAVDLVLMVCVCGDMDLVLHFSWLS